MDTTIGLIQINDWLSDWLRDAVMKMAVYAKQVFFFNEYAVCLCPTDREVKVLILVMAVMQK